MTGEEAKRKLVEVNARLDDALLASRRELTAAEGRLGGAVGKAQGRLDTVGCPQEFDARGFASEAVAVLEAWGEYGAAKARRALLEALARELA
jgi:hypothetical protein